MGELVDFDPYVLEVGHYDQDDFYCGSVDRKGHHASLHLSLKPSVSSRIDQLVASKNFPAYKTKGHFVRDAIVHRLNYLAARSEDTELARFVRLEVHAARLESLKAEQQQLIHMLEEYNDMLKACRDRGDQPGLNIVLERIISAAEDMRDPWDQQLLALANRYK